MPLVSRTLKLRLLYQIFEAPATAASDPRVASSVTKRARRVKADSFSRTDGMTSVSPIRGNLKRVSSPVQEWVRRRLDHYRDTLLYAYTAVLALLAASLIAGMVWSGVDTGPPYGVVVLAVLALLAERQSIRLAPSIEVSTASLILVFAAVAFSAQTTHDLGVLVVAVCAAAVVEALADLALGAVTQMIRKGGSVREVF